MKGKRFVFSTLQQKTFRYRYRRISQKNNFIKFFPLRKWRVKSERFCITSPRIRAKKHVFSRELGGKCACFLWKYHNKGLISLKKKEKKKTSLLWLRGEMCNKQVLWDSPILKTHSISIRKQILRWSEYYRELILHSGQMRCYDYFTPGYFYFLRCL